MCPLFLRPREDKFLFPDFPFDTIIYLINTFGFMTK